MNREFRDEEIAQRLFETAQSRANSRGFAFKRSASSLVKGLAQYASANVRGRSLETNRSVELSIKDAEVSFKRLIDAMIKSAGEIPGYDAGRLGEQTYESALKRICPLWPICK